MYRSVSLMASGPESLPGPPVPGSPRAPTVEISSLEPPLSLQNECCCFPDGQHIGGAFTEASLGVRRRKAGAEGWGPVAELG